MKAVIFRQIRSLPMDQCVADVHNPKVGGSNPPPATNLKQFPFNHLKRFASVVRNRNRLPFGSHSLEDFAGGQNLRHSQASLLISSRRSGTKGSEGRNRRRAASMLLRAHFRLGSVRSIEDGGGNCGLVV